MSKNKKSAMASQGEKNAKRFGDYIAELARQMCLYDWRLEIFHEPLNDKGNAAMIECIYGQKKAFIHLSQDFHLYEPEKQRHYLVHELVHCHLEQTVMPIKDVLSKESYKIWTNAFEYSTDAIASVIAPHMPLPPKQVSPKRASKIGS